MPAELTNCPGCVENPLGMRDTVIRNDRGTIDAVGNVAFVA